MEIDEININNLREMVYQHGASFDNITYFFRQLRTEFESTKSQAERFLLLQDRNRLEALLLNNAVIIDSRTESYYQERFLELTKTVFANFIDVAEKPKLFIVDELAGSGKEKAWDALFFDDLDEKRLGYPRGIYFKRSSINLPYFDFTVTHEAIHWIISSCSKDNLLYTTMLEEGLCDFLTYYYLLKLNPDNSKIVSNIMTFIRVLKPQESVFKNYYHFSKVISNFVIANGIEALIEVIKGGRKEVNNLPTTSILPIATSDSTLSQLNLCFGTAEANLVLRPEGYLLLRSIFDSQLRKFKSVEVVSRFMDPYEVEKELKCLYDLNLLNFDGDWYYQNLAVFPSNIKYKVSYE